MPTRDGMIVGGKRLMEEDGDEVTNETAPKRAKDLYAAMKAACTAQKYQEAINFCSEALGEEGLSKKFQTQFLLARSSTYSKMDKSFSSLAIKDAKQAIILSPKRAMPYLRAANALYQAGHKSKAIQALTMAESYASNETTEMSYIKNLKREWCLPKIHELPEEILIEIFKGFSISELATCIATCRRWKDVLKSNPRLWGQDVSFTGTFADFEVWWKKVYVVTGGGQVSKLTLDLLDRENENVGQLLKLLRQSTLQRTFPSETLNYFYYEGRSRILSTKIWSLVKHCKRLKYLTFKSGYRGEVEAVDYRIEGTPLANCRLEYFSFWFAGNSILDRPYVDLTSQAKVIRIRSCVAHARLNEMIRAARHTLECLILISGSLDVSKYNDLPELDPSQEEPIEMDKLHTLHVTRDKHYQVHKHIAPKWNFKIPNATEIGIDDDQLERSTLESCLKSVVTFEYNFESSSGGEVLVGTLSGMNNCESITILCLPEENESTMSRALFQKKPELFPKLKTIELCGDAQLRGADVIKFIGSRSALGLPSIETLRLYGCHQVDSESVAYLRRNIQKFSYSDHRITNIIY